MLTVTQEKKPIAGGNLALIAAAKQLFAGFQ